MFQNLIVDSGVVVKWFVPESDSAIARLIYSDYHDGSFELLAPNLISVEFGNIIWKKHAFQGLTLSRAQLAIDAFKKVEFTFSSAENLFDDAFQIAVKHRRSFYDSLYLALSVRENCQFVTADEKLYNAVTNDFPNLVLLANWK